MHSPKESTRLLRTAAWIWLGFLLAMAVMDLVLYTQTNLPITQNLPLQQITLGQQLPPNQLGIQPGQPNNLQRNPLRPVYLFYCASGLVAVFFFIFAHSTWTQKKLGQSFYPLLLLTISTAPIMINVLITPRFPQGPLANAEGMALRRAAKVVEHQPRNRVTWLEERALHIVEQPRGRAGRA